MFDQKIMRPIGERAVVFSAFVAFCFFSSIRDVLSEMLFKHQEYGAHPIFVLFVYSVTTQVVAAAILLTVRGSSTETHASVAGGKDIALLNVFTLFAFLFYFLAIQSPLGAAMNAFVDYGSGPIFTAVVGAVLMRERLGKIFVFSAVLSIAGLAILGMPRLYSHDISLFWVTGLVLALLSSLSSALYRVYFKILLEKGMEKLAIMIVRLFGITVFSGAVLLMRPELFRSDIVVETAVLGLLGFALPLFLILTIIQRVQIRRFAMMLFLFPVLTLLFSASMGYAAVYLTDVVAVGLILAGIAFHERTYADASSRR